MKKIITAVALLATLTVGAWAQSVRDSAVRTYRGGFQTKERVYDDGNKLLLVKFPARCTVREPSEQAIKTFKACILQAERLITGRKGFPEGRKGVIQGEQGEIVGIIIEEQVARPRGPISEGR